MIRPSYVLYGLGLAFFAAGYVQELRELKESHAVWVKATDISDMNGSSSSQSSPPQQPSRPITSES